MKKRFVLLGILAIATLVVLYQAESWMSISTSRPALLNPLVKIVTEATGNFENRSTSFKQQVRHKGGYMLSLRYYEQQTQATRNLLQMQCLAHSVGMRIVEPFVIKSMFVIPLYDHSMMEKHSQKSLLTFGDVVDTQVWNTEAFEKFGYTSIASWEEFLRNAPRKIVVSCIRQRSPPKVLLPITGYDFHQGCPGTCFNVFDNSMNYLRQFGFRLVRKSCFNFVDFGGSILEDKFFENALGDYSPNEVTLLMNEFRGFFGFYRLPINSECGIVHFRTNNISILPSPRVLTDSQKYSTDVFRGRPYVAVVARIERVVLHRKKNMSKCSQEVVQILESINSSRGVSSTFLAMDIGRFGSQGSIRNNLQPYGEALFNSIYGNKWSFGEWEESFENSSSSNNPAYVANLQRTIAASGSCLILVGGGGFQSQAKNLYVRLHPDPSLWCIYLICG